MAPTIPRSKKAKSKSRHLKKHRDPPTKTPRQLYAEATAALTQGDAEAAVKAAELGLEAAVDDALKAALHTALGEAHLELGDAEAARRHLLAAVEADPDGKLAEDLGGGADKFLYLAQLSDEGGRDSVGWFERGAAVLRAEAEALPAPGSARGAAARRRLASVLCAVAEVYMTDLSLEAEAEAQCERLAGEAALLAPDSADVWQTLASVRLSQGREDEARAALDRSLAAWEGLAPGHPDVPDFPVRVSLVRLLMSAGRPAKAAAVAERCVRDDDQSVEVWYLGGYALHLLAAEAAAAAAAETDHQPTPLWRASRRWLRTCLALFAAQQYEDDRLREHAEELLAAIKEQLRDDDSDNDDEEDEEDDNDDDDDEDEDEDDKDEEWDDMEDDEGEGATEGD